MIKTIAEISINHRNSLEHTKELIRLAKGVGFDYVKFQAYSVDDFIHERKEREGFDRDFFEHYKMTPELLSGAVRYCQDTGMKWGVTPTVSRLDEVCELQPDFLKIGSDQARSGVLVSMAYKRDADLFISTGMMSEREVLELPVHAVIFHCTSQYPTYIQHIHMGRLLEIRKKFPRVGYSDHGESGEASFLAIFSGAQYLEKHIALPGDVDDEMGFATTGEDQMKSYINKIKDGEKLLGALTLNSSKREMYEREKWLKW